MTKKFNHKKYCADHVKVEGYSTKVCILKGQEPDPIIRFANAMVRLARAFHIEVKKPGPIRKPSNTVHGGCEGHFDFPGMGAVCYGGYTGWSKEQAYAFCKEVRHNADNNPRYDLTRYDVSKLMGA